MKLKFKTLTSAIVFSSLVACGGHGTDMAAQDSSESNLPAVQNDSATTPRVTNAPSLAGAAQSDAVHDLIIGNVNASASFTDQTPVSFTFSVEDLSNAGIPLDDLSIVLEIAASGSFIDAYRQPLYDITPVDRVRFNARSAPIDLPDGSYQARLVVNPSWRYSFAVAPASHSHMSSFRYFTERDYRNNASGVFQASVSTDTVCAEDSFENNDNHQSAQPIPVGGQVDASLCTDHVDIYSVQLAANEKASIAFNYKSAQAARSKPTRYIVLDSSFTSQADPALAKDAHTIDIESSIAGSYYVAIFGGRSDYRLTRFADSRIPGLAEDFADTSLFSPGSEVDGPQSWLLGQIKLQQLAITEDKLTNQAINCGRITTQYDNGEPLAYVTPNHFADLHRIEFFHNGEYLIDGEPASGWSVRNGDIVLNNWYENEYSGHAERVSDDRWRYWTRDGLAYVECSIEL